MERPAEVWILSRSRRGDLNQMIDLAEAVGASYEIIRLPNDAADDASLSTQIVGYEPPRVVISAERSATEMALAIKTQAGGRTKAVSIGRPGGRIDEFDLVITAPHFRVEPAQNVLELATPLHTLDEEAMRSVAEAMRRDVEALPRPFTAALVGGSSGRERMTAQAAARLGRQLAARARRTGGSLLVTTSPRTPDDAAQALVRETAGLGKFYLWSRDMAINPYAGLLYLADEFVVTSDSASMPIEAALTGKPVYLHRLPRNNKFKEVALEAAHRWRRWLPPVDAMFRSGALQARADRSLLFEALERQGVLKAFSADASDWSPRPFSSSVERAAEAVRELLVPTS